MLRVLGIETSCDDTGVAIVNSEGEILSNCIHSQLAIHNKNGGILPPLARDYHAKSINSLAQQALEQSGLSLKQDVDAIAVTNRPGMKLSLQVGLRYAKDLATKYAKPMIPIHHMQAHALTALMRHKSAIHYPFLGFLISGGHCILTLVNGHDKFLLLGQTIDEAPGDTLDKVARRLRVKNLGHPYDTVSGGQAIEMLSRVPGANENSYFDTGLNQVPMAKYKNCDFSFSGYRNTVDKLIGPKFDHMMTSGIEHDNLMQELGHVCASLQRAISNQMIRKIQRALHFCRLDCSIANSVDKNPNKCIDLVISGGVASNQYLGRAIKEFCTKHWDENMKVYIPEKSLCTDNGAMIAWNGVLKLADYKNAKPEELENYKDVIYDVGRLHEVNIHREMPIGEDIRDRLASMNIKLPKLRRSKQTEIINDDTDDEDENYDGGIGKV